MNIGNLHVDFISKKELLDRIDSGLATGQSTWLTTLNSEFLLAALKSQPIAAMLNRSDIAVVDGIGVLWLHRFLELRADTKIYYLRALLIFFQLIYTLLEIIFRPRVIQVTEKIVGAELFWDLIRIFDRHGIKVFFFGNWGEAAEKTAEIVKELFPNLVITGTSNAASDDPFVISRIREAGTEAVLVGFGPVKQEQWIDKYKNELRLRFVCGIGGTFEYASGKYPMPPTFVRKSGFEWAWRLVTQMFKPNRLRRVLSATFGLMLAAYRYKFWEAYPLRENVVVVIANKQNKVLVCKRKFNVVLQRDFENYNFAEDHWQFPQGGVNHGETIEEAGRREVFEETSLNNLDLLTSRKHVHAYNWTSGIRRVWLSKSGLHRGQNQSLTVWRHLDSDDKVKLDQHEFDEYKWVSLNELPGILHFHRQSLYADIKDILHQTLK